MTEWEKLYELIVDAENEFYKNNHHAEDSKRIESVVERLIAHGVKVKQMQKPLTLEEVKNIRDVIVWAELNSSELFPVRIDGTRLFNLEQREDVWGVVRSSYNKGWRFWANRPTEEERKAAEWKK